MLADSLQNHQRPVGVKALQAKNEHESYECPKSGCTLEFLNKKHLNFGQGLEFLKFGQGNRGLNQQIQRKSKEHIRTTKGKTRKNR